MDGMIARRLSAVGLIILLYIAATPFTPVSWFFYTDFAFLADTVGAGVLLLCACYFQWRISGLTHALAIPLPTLGNGIRVVNGRVEQQAGIDIFLWKPSNYWPCVLGEALLLFFATAGPSEMLRRGIILAVVSGLWFLGWHATPAATKQWAWEHIRDYVFWQLLSEFMSGGRHTAGRRRARRRY
jgi:hypothetical protein